MKRLSDIAKDWKVTYKVIFDTYRDLYFTGKIDVIKGKDNVILLSGEAVEKIEAKLREKGYEKSEVYSAT